MSVFYSGMGRRLLGSKGCSLGLCFVLRDGTLASVGTYFRGTRFELRLPILTLHTVHRV
jgi:hypothetical protein